MRRHGNSSSRTKEKKKKQNGIYTNLPCFLGIQHPLPLAVKTSVGVVYLLVYKKNVEAAASGKGSNVGSPSTSKIGRAHV